MKIVVDKNLMYDALNCLKRLTNSVRHASYCRAPVGYECTCDADQLWKEGKDMIARINEMPHEEAK